MAIRILTLAVYLTCAGGILMNSAWSEDLRDRVEDGYADSNGVKIHYVTLGEGPLVVMIHGFPDFWYTWRHQMEALADQYQVVAMDQRGYNLSDKPVGQENYDVSLLGGDVEAVITHLGAEKATVVGHDWGGMVAWWFAMNKPERVERLIICNLPHPKGISRELAHNPEQQKNSAYARAFQQPDAHKAVTKEFLANLAVGKDTAALPIYREAFERSDLEAMLHYYKQNYPREPYVEDTRLMPKVQAPVLLFHGLMDSALHHHALDRTWEWVAGELSIVTIPEANHWVHHDAAEQVSATMRDWLARH